MRLRVSVGSVQRGKPPACAEGGLQPCAGCALAFPRVPARPEHPGQPHSLLTDIWRASDGLDVNQNPPSELIN